MSALKPTSTKLLVTPYRRDNQWGGVIHLLEKQRYVLLGDDHCFWVVAVGDGIEDIKVKDRVILQQDHEGLEYLTDGTKRAFVNLKQVLLVLPHDGFQEPVTYSMATARSLV